MDSPNYLSDPLLRLLLVEAPGRGGEPSSVTTLDHDLYGRTWTICADRARWAVRPSLP